MEKPSWALMLTSPPSPLLTGSKAFLFHLPSLFLAVLGTWCWAGLFGCGERGCSPAGGTVFSGGGVSCGARL